MQNKRKSLLGTPQITCPPDRVLAKGYRPLHSCFTSYLRDTASEPPGRGVQRTALLHPIPGLFIKRGRVGKEARRIYLVLDEQAGVA